MKPRPRVSTRVETYVIRVTIRWRRRLSMPVRAKSCTWVCMRRQKLWCPHTIGLLTPPSQTHGCFPCAAAAGANGAVAVKTRSDVLYRAGRWHSYSQPCGRVLGLEQPFL